MMLVHKLSAINRNGWKYTRDHLTHPGLTNSMYDVCGVIYHAKPSNQEFIASSLKMDKSALAKVVSKCVDDGLILREVNPSNRREHILTLTEKGYETVKELVELVDSWQNEALSVLENDQRELFMEMINKVLEHTNTMNKE